MRIGPWLGALLLAHAGTVVAADKVSPAFLRERHAGAQVFASPEPLRDLYPKLLEAAQDCKAGRIKPGAGTGVTSGALAAMSSARREVVGELSPDGGSATIMVRAIGAFGALKSNYLQLDLTREDAGTRVEGFHRMNVKGQRAFFVEVAHWLAGEWDYCEPDPFFNKTPKET